MRNAATVLLGVILAGGSAAGYALLSKKDTPVTSAKAVASMGAEPRIMTATPNKSVEHAAYSSNQKAIDLRKKVEAQVNQDSASQPVSNATEEVSEKEDVKDNTNIVKHDESKKEVFQSSLFANREEAIEFLEREGVVCKTMDSSGICIELEFANESSLAKGFDCSYKKTKHPYPVRSCKIKNEYGQKISEAMKVSRE